MNTRTLAAVLTYLGSIPFWGLAIYAHSQLPHAHNASVWLEAYAAIILSFLSGIHWGLALQNDQRLSCVLLFWSNVVALAAWLTLLIPQPYANLLLIVGFVSQWVMDNYLSKLAVISGWFYQLRRNISVIVVLILLINLL